MNDLQENLLERRRLMSKIQVMAVAPARQYPAQKPEVGILSGEKEIAAFRVFRRRQY